MNLWYQKPADSWDEALPLGNGMLEAMVYGGMENERIQLNEDSLWSGCYIDRNNIDAYGNLEGIRRMIFDGNIKEAQKLAIDALSGTPQSQRCYQTLGDLLITFENQAGKYL